MTDITKKFYLKSELLDKINAVENYYNRRDDIRLNDLSVPCQRSPLHGPGVHVITVSCH